jgi:hypothetical protein
MLSMEGLIDPLHEDGAAPAGLKAGFAPHLRFCFSQPILAIWVVSVQGQTAVFLHSRG